MKTLAEMRTLLGEIRAEITEIDGLAEKESRARYASEDRKLKALRADEAPLVERIDKMVEAQRAAELNANAHKGNDPEWRTAGTGVGGTHVTGEPSAYNEGNSRDVSYFRDMVNARRGHADAADRLRRNNMEVAETRGATTAAGAGGEFAPPLHLIAEFVALQRSSRVTADNATTSQALPGGVSSISVPKVSSGTSAAVQTTQLSALSNTDITTTSLTSGISTIGGLQLVSTQLVNQSGAPGIDHVIMADLASAYAKALNQQVLMGSGASGQLKGLYTAALAGTNNVVWTQASPTVPLLISQINKLVAQFSSTRFAAPDYLVMSPLRWASICAAVDSTGRPLVVPNAGGAQFNSVASAGPLAAEGAVGHIAGVPVWADAAVPATLGAGTQDFLILGRKGDALLWESPVSLEIFDAPYADQAGILFRALGYAAFIPQRYATGLLTGTGMAATGTAFLS